MPGTDWPVGYGGGTSWCSPPWKFCPLAWAFGTWPGLLSTYQLLKKMFAVGFYLVGALCKTKDVPTYPCFAKIFSYCVWLLNFIKDFFGIC